MEVLCLPAAYLFVPGPRGVICAVTVTAVHILIACCVAIPCHAKVVRPKTLTPNQRMAYGMAKKERELEREVAEEDANNGEQGRFGGNGAIREMARSARSIQGKYFNQWAVQRRSMSRVAVGL
jgi:hypothetical protein